MKGENRNAKANIYHKHNWIQIHFYIEYCKRSQEPSSEICQQNDIQTFLIDAEIFASNNNFLQITDKNIHIDTINIK